MLELSAISIYRYPFALGQVFSQSADWCHKIYDLPPKMKLLLFLQNVKNFERKIMKVSESDKEA